MQSVRRLGSELLTTRAKLNALKSSRFIAQQLNTLRAPVCSHTVTRLSRCLPPMVAEKLAQNAPMSRAKNIHRRACAVALRAASRFCWGTRENLRDALICLRLRQARSRGNQLIEIGFIRGGHLTLRECMSEDPSSFHWGGSIRYVRFVGIRAKETIHEIGIRIETLGSKLSASGLIRRRRTRTDHRCSCGGQECDGDHERCRPCQKTMGCVSEINLIAMDIRPLVLKRPAK
jgi:hypothetical protein